MCDVAGVTWRVWRGAHVGDERGSTESEDDVERSGSEHEQAIARAECVPVEVGGL